MKTLLIAIIILSSALPKVIGTPSDYERNLSNIAGQFKANIMDKDECENKMNDLTRLIDDIEEDLDKDDKFSPNDITQLRQIKQKADALRQYIGAVGHCGNTFPTIDQFNTANRMVGGDLTIVSQGKYCVDIITVSINKYRVYLAQNNTFYNYTVNYQWKSLDAQSNGKGSMGLASKCLRPFYDNREDPSKIAITIFGVTCKEFLHELNALA